MLRPIDRSRRDGPLYPGFSRTLRDSIDPQHLVIRIDTAFDFAGLVAHLERSYSAIGRPAIHPEVVLRALLLAAIYEVHSCRQLCERISENLAWRWFCFLTLDDRVFDHSTLSVFLDRVGADGLADVFERLNDALLEAGLLSRRVYLDSSLIPANVRTQALSPRDPTDPAPQRLEERDGVWVTIDRQRGTETEPATLVVRRFQDQAGRLPLPLHDLDARWRTIRGVPTLGFKEHLVADRSGFILAQGRTGADVSDVAGALPVLDRLPLVPWSLAADTSYRAGRFRRELRLRGITSYIPLDHKQREGVPAGFIDQHDHLLCPAGKRLRQIRVPDEQDSVAYRASPSDCQPCPLRAGCLSPSMQAKQVWLSWYRLETQRAARRNQTRQYEREMRRRKTVIEGVFARLDRLGGTRTRFRGLERVSAHGSVTALAHNILKALTKRRFGKRVAGALPRPRQEGIVLPAALWLQPVRTCLTGAPRPHHGSLHWHHVII
jgi:transposase